jgi:hypothetical protein
MQPELCLFEPNRFYRKSEARRVTGYGSAAWDRFVERFKIARYGFSKRYVAYLGRDLNAAMESAQLRPWSTATKGVGHE